jgi:hypothetical protein
MRDVSRGRCRNPADVLTLGGADLAGWQLLETHAISLDGRFIAGYRQNSNGAREAWLVDLRAAYPSCIPKRLVGPLIRFALVIEGERGCVASPLASRLISCNRGACAQVGLMCAELVDHHRRV